MSKSIAYMISSYDIYGAGKVVFNEIRWRRQKKSILVLIWPNTKTPFIEKVKKTDIPFYHLISHSKFDLLAIVKLINFLRKNNVGLLHSNGYKSDVIGLIACRLLNIPIVTTVHGWCSEDWKVKIYEKMQAISWRFFDRVICVSESYKKKALQFWVPENKLKVIHNGIIADEYTIKDDNVRVNILSKYGIPQHHFVVGIIGRLGIEKGHQYFLEAAKQVLRQESDVSFIIVGDGTEENNIRRYIDKLGLNGNIHMVGYVEKMKEIYATLDAVVMASLREGLPNVLLEAMACEKPVVATNVGGIPEVIRDNQEGILVPPKNSSAITDALLTLIRNPEQGRRIASGAKKRVLEDFTFENVMKQIENLYDEVIQKYRLN